MMATLVSDSDGHSGSKLHLQLIDLNGTSLAVELPSDTLVSEVKRLAQSCFQQNHQQQTSSQLQTASMCQQPSINAPSQQQQLHFKQNLQLHHIADHWYADYQHFVLPPPHVVQQQLHIAQQRQHPQANHPLHQHHNHHHHHHHFVNPISCASSSFPVLLNLICVRQKRSLHDDRSLKAENLGSDETLLLLPKLLPNDLDLKCDPSSKAPSVESIADATKNLTPHNQIQETSKRYNNSDFKKELRRILVALIDFSETLVRDTEDEEVREIFKDVSKYVAPEPIETEQFDQTMIKQLMEMGFSREKVERALKITKMNQMEAMDWLLAYESSTHSKPLNQAVPLHSTEEENGDKQQVDSETIDQNTSIASQKYPRVPAIVNKHRQYRRAMFQPNPKSLSNMQQMGFDETEILDSLWIYNNNENAACEWLLNEHRPKTNDLTIGISRESQLYKALLSDPVVQIGLMKPKVFLTFLHLIEEPVSATKWIRDGFVMRVFHQMNRIYYLEKHFPSFVPPELVGAMAASSFQTVPLSSSPPILNPIGSGVSTLV